MKIIIGLAGVKTAGKSTVTNMIKEFFPNAKESALADALKNVCAENFNLKREQFDRQDLKEKPFEEGKLVTTKIFLNILTSFNVTPHPEMIIKAENSGLFDRKLNSPREIAQIVGTEILREYAGEDCHCENVDLSADINIISDIRFPNELSYFSNNVFFFPFYIAREEAESKVTENSHISERLVMTFKDKCIKIDNNGDLLMTRAQVRSQMLDLLTQINAETLERVC